MSEKAVVKTKSGKIQGIYQNGIYMFMGVPYAAPPAGERRWLPPQPVKPWQGVRPALKFGPITPQNGIGTGVVPELAVEGIPDEDCLNLNIWSPGLDDAHRPVLVWIHGGAFNQGAGSQPLYTGDKLVRRGDVVVVTINYRLGLLGFLRLDEVTGGRIPATGNEGLLDQIAAITWVRDNIAGFGGDPDNITIFGESAGGISIGCLLSMPSARGLFHKAILQSGASMVTPLKESVLIAEKFLLIFGFNAGDVDALKALTVEQILSAEMKLRAEMARPWEKLRATVTQPIVDGKTLPAIPVEAVKQDSAGNVLVMAGSNQDEWGLIGMADRGLPELDEAGLAERCQRLIPAKRVPVLVEAYRAARVKRGEDASPPAIYRAIQTDSTFRMPAIKFVESQQRRHRSSYSYLFTWKSPAMGGILGACHTLEIGFVFGTYTQRFNGSGPAAELLAGNIQDAWTAFARTGDPSNKGIGTWPEYGENRATMILGADCHVEEAPYDEERHVWDVILGSSG